MITSRVTRAVYRALPRRAQITARAAFGGLLFARRTSGVAAASTWDDRVPVSIVIPSYNDLRFLKKCLASIKKTCTAFEYEVLVVDDFCEPVNRKKLAQLDDGVVHVIFREQRGGFAKAVNTGIREARWDVVLLNSDTVARPSWLEALQSAAYTRPGVGLVSPMLVYPDGLVQYGGTYYARRLAPQWYGHLYVGRTANDPLANQPWFIRSVSGACVYIRHEVILAIGGLDEEFWLGFEDVDFGLRAWDAGFRSWYEPSAKLVHHESATRGYSQGKRELGSMRYFWRKWAPMVMERNLDSLPPVVFLTSLAASPVWREYVLQLAAELAELGAGTAVHEVTDTIDEEFVRTASSGISIVVAADRGTVETAWLATQAKGIPVYLLPGIDAESADLTEAQRLSASAGYRPEFEFVPPNRWAAERLAGISAWETRAIVAPALRPNVATRFGSGVVIVGGSDEEIASAEAVAEGQGVSVTRVAGSGLSREDLDRVGSLAPRAVVSFVEYQHSLEPLALMSMGAAYLGVINERTRYEVLDGYNALLFPRLDMAALARSLADVLSDDGVYAELSSNGRNSATLTHAANAKHLYRTLVDIAERAF